MFVLYLDDDPSDDGLGMRELIGIVVGGAIVVMMIVLCCILLLCAFVTRGEDTHGTNYYTLT